MNLQNPPAESATLGSAKAIAPWLWGVPVAMFVLAAPLWLQQMEPGLFIRINALCMAWPDTVWAALSLMGNAWGVLALTAPLLVLAPRLMWAWICAVPFAVAFARLGKAFIESPRPAAVVDNAQMHVVGELLHNVSMPSGHTTTAFAVASAIYFALPSATRARHGWLFVLAALTGLSRIAVGAHWPGDVAVGASLGLLAGLLSTKLLVRMDVRHLQPMAWSQRLVGVTLAATVVALSTESLDFDENRPVQYLLATMVLVVLAVFLRRQGFGKNRL